MHAMHNLHRFTDYQITHISGGGRGNGDDWPPRWLREMPPLKPPTDKFKFINLVHLLPATPPPLPVLVPSTHSEQPSSALLSLPVETLVKILSYLPWAGLQAPTKEQFSSVDSMDKNDFKDLAEQIYAVALSCRTFCLLTKQQRTAILFRGRFPMPTSIFEIKTPRVAWKPTPLTLRSVDLMIPLCSLQISRSFTNECMMQLLSWRNNSNPVSIGEKIANAGKVVAVELALPVLSIAAAVETIVYKILRWTAQALRPITEQPFAWCKTKKILEREQNSVYTMSETIRMLYHNIFNKSL